MFDISVEYRSVNSNLVDTKPVDDVFRVLW